MRFLKAWRRADWPPRVEVWFLPLPGEGLGEGAKFSAQYFLERTWCLPGKTLDQRRFSLSPSPQPSPKGRGRKDQGVFMAYAAGVDVGSTQTKAVIIDEAGEIVGRALIDTGANVIAAAENAFALAADSLDEREVEYVIGTGYGRYRVTFGNAQVTEISCHGRGAVHMFPQTRTVVDMGGQDTKAIRVNATGEIVDFCMNDKCAAGTGRFLGAAS